MQTLCHSMPHRTEGIICAKISSRDYKFHTLKFGSIFDNNATFAKIFPPKLNKIPEVKISILGQHIIITFVSIQFD